MSISPSSDIVLGVANAADPTKLRAAVERLSTGAGANAATLQSPAETVSSTAKAAPSRPASTSGPVTIADRNTATATRVQKSSVDPYKEFEAYFLQTFVEAMLPKDTKSLFGSDPGGNIWKSMMAEYMAREMAKSTAFGIAEQIAGDRKRQSDASSSIVQPQESASALSGTDSSLAQLHKILATDGAPSSGGV